MLLQVLIQRENNDFHSETVDITFAPGETGPKPIPVTLTDDKDVEPNEKIYSDHHDIFFIFLLKNY